MTEPNRKRIAILVNMLTPYRAPLYNHLAGWFDIDVLVGSGEDNRPEWSGTEEELDRVTYRAVPGITVPFRKRGRGGRVEENRFLHFTYGFWGELGRLKPDLIVSVEMGFRTLLALLFGWRAKTPVWVWWGGTAHTQRDFGWLRRRVRGVIVRHADGWISYGTEATSYLQSLGVARARIVQIQNCVDERRYQSPASPLFEVHPKPVLLLAGRLIAWKGIDLYLRAAREAQERGARFATLIVGDGPDRAFLESLVAEIGLSDVVFAGRVADIDMPRVYRSADALIFPTLHDAWGLVVNEALWAGLPVVSSKYAGCSSELLAPELVFDPEDINSFADLIAALADRRVPADLPEALRPLADVGDQLASAIQERLSRSPSSGGLGSSAIG